MAGLLGRRPAELVADRVERESGVRVVPGAGVDSLGLLLGGVVMEQAAETERNRVTLPRADVERVLALLIGLRDGGSFRQRELAACIKLLEAV
jgi:hypothetical protein